MGANDLFLLVLCVVGGIGALKDCNISTLSGTKTYLDLIFNKYGDNGKNSEFITISQFDKLMKNLYLGSVTVKCQDGDETCQKNSTTNHGTISSNYNARLRRDTTEVVHKKDHNNHWLGHLLNVSHHFLFMLFGN